MSFQPHCLYQQWYIITPLVWCEVSQWRVYYQIFFGHNPNTMCSFHFFSLSFSVCLFFHSTLKTMWLALLTYHFTTLLLAHGQNACTGHSTFRAPGQRHQSVPIVIVCAFLLFSTCWIYILVSKGKLSLCCYVPYFLELLMIFGCFLTSKVFWMLKTHGSYLIIKSYLLSLWNISLFWAITITHFNLKLW